MVKLMPGYVEDVAAWQARLEDLAAKGWFYVPSWIWFGFASFEWGTPKAVRYRLEPAAKKEKCPDCYGSGYISSRKKIQVTIPAGIDNGQSIRIAGKGEPGINGGDRGDLLVEVTVSKHPIFKRQETTIFSTVPISFVTAALGGPIRIKTVDGEVEYEVKPGTQTDTKVRLRGKGVPSLRNKNIRGDHFVTLVITVPEKLNEEQKEALRRFDDAMNGIAPEGGKKKRGLFGK